MRFHPRHYLLIAVILALGVWNYLRVHRAHPAAEQPHFAGHSTPAWQAFDQAAAQRDAPDAQFSPALENLRSQADAATGPDAPDLRNCLMWLQYYRHAAPRASGNSKNWDMLATGHVHTCVTQHRDLGQ